METYTENNGLIFDGEPDSFSFEEAIKDTIQLFI